MLPSELASPDKGLLKGVYYLKRYLGVTYPVTMIAYTALLVF